MSGGILPAWRAAAKSVDQNRGGRGGGACAGDHPFDLNTSSHTHTLSLSLISLARSSLTRRQAFQRFARGQQRADLGGRRAAPVPATATAAAGAAGAGARACKEGREREERGGARSGRGGLAGVGRARALEDAALAKEGDGLELRPPPLSLPPPLSFHPPPPPVDDGVTLIERTRQARRAEGGVRAGSERQPVGRAGPTRRSIVWECVCGSTLLGRKGRGSCALSRMRAQRRRKQGEGGRSEGFLFFTPCSCAPQPPP